MRRDEILFRVQETFRDLLNQDDIVLTEETNLIDIEGWTSLMHVQILSELEHEFCFRFSLAELMAVKNVCDIIDAIAKRSA